MKRISIFMLVVMLVAFSLIACGKADMQGNPKDSGQTKGQTEDQTVKESEANGSESSQTEQNGAKKILVAYFSWAENAKQDDIDAMTSPSVKEPGNVAQLCWTGCPCPSAPASLWRCWVITARASLPWPSI